MTLTNKQINDLLKSNRDQKFRKKTQGQIDANTARHAGLIAALENPNFAKERAKKQRENNPEMQEQINKSLKQHYQDNPMPDERKVRISKKMKGKTLEEILGEERAAAGKEVRSQTHKGKKRPKEVGIKISATRRANGSYEINGMTGKEHKESTKSIMSIKAQVRQELKRRLGLGKSDKVPLELLTKEYKKLGLG